MSTSPDPNIIVREKGGGGYAEISADGGATWQYSREYVCHECLALYWGLVGGTRGFREPCPECGAEGPHACDTFGCAYWMDGNGETSLSGRVRAGKVMHRVPSRIPAGWEERYDKMGWPDITEKEVSVV